MSSRDDYDTNLAEQQVVWYKEFLQSLCQGHEPCRWDIPLAFLGHPDHDMEVPFTLEYRSWTDQHNKWPNYWPEFRKPKLPVRPAAKGEIFDCMKDDYLFHQWHSSPNIWRNSPVLYTAGHEEVCLTTRKEIIFKK